MGPDMTLSLRDGDDLPERLWAYDEFDTTGDPRPGDLPGGLVSLGYLRSELRRRWRLWCALALAGFLAGLGVLVALPPADQASTSLLLTNPPNAPVGTAILDDQAMAQSRAVAAIALRRLGLNESPAAFTGQYIATVVTDRVLLITAKATTGPLAVREANAVAAAFLSFQAGLLQNQAQAVNSTLTLQVSQAQAHIKTLTSEITRLSALPPSAALTIKLHRLKVQRGKADTALITLQQTAAGNKATTQVQNETVIKGSAVLDAATLLHSSRKKELVLYAAIGLIVGLALGVGIVVIRALLSDRLRRRDDVARIVGAPVKLSVGQVRLRRGADALALAEQPDVRRITSYLAGAVQRDRNGPRSLAVIPVDDPQVPAACLVTLALSYARKGRKVAVADLCRGAPAARLLGAGDEPGVREVGIQAARVTVAVPEPDDVAPLGPFDRAARQNPAAEPLAAACAAADIVLSLVALEPGLGADHLPGWTRAAVATVTAGRSSATRVHAVGEMIRTAGTPLVSAVLIGSDKTDESIGVTSLPLLMPTADQVS
jgi:hypothetical protein